MIPLICDFSVNFMYFFPKFMVMGRHIWLYDSRSDTYTWSKFVLLLLGVVISMGFKYWYSTLVDELISQTMDSERKTWCPRMSRKTWRTKMSCSNCFRWQCSLGKVHVFLNFSEYSWWLNAFNSLHISYIGYITCHIFKAKVVCWRVKCVWKQGPDPVTLVWIFGKQEMWAGRTFIPLDSTTIIVTDFTKNLLLS